MSWGLLNGTSYDFIFIKSIFMDNFVWKFGFLTLFVEYVEHME